MRRDFVTLDTNLILRVRNELGWVIVPCSCRSGYAWMKPRPSGAQEMVGCISKVDLRAVLEPTPVELKRMEAIKMVDERLNGRRERFQESFDNIIHERFGQMAAGINNGGIDEQLEYLFGECDSIAEVNRMLGYLEEVLS